MRWEHLGDKNWTRSSFCSQTFRAPLGYPAEKPGTSRQRVWFSWVWGTYRTFWSPPLHVEDLHPTRSYPDQKFGFGFQCSGLSTDREVVMQSLAFSSEPYMYATEELRGDHDIIAQVQLSVSHGNSFSQGTSLAKPIDWAHVKMWWSVVKDTHAVAPWTIVRTPYVNLVSIAVKHSFNVVCFGCSFFCLQLDVCCLQFSVFTYSCQF